MLMNLLRRWQAGRAPPPTAPAAPGAWSAPVDEMTGLGSRRALVALLQEACDDSRPGMLALVDIDRFKLLNDRFGHSVGDDTLRQLAARLRARLPPNAAIFRLGGDEFAVCLPSGAPASARGLLADMVRWAREPLTLPSGCTVEITVSIGAVAFEGRSHDAVLRDADVALYLAKARGRDQSAIYGQGTRIVHAARRELAAQVAQLQAINRALQDEARTDALTGLRNRLALDEVLDTPVGTAASPWPHAGLAFIDVDHFGQYNHCHGDPAGDEALRRVAQALRRQSRDTDLVFRKGGEEMVLLLADVNQDNAAAAGERLRAAVESLGIPHEGSSVSKVLTVTVGIATGAPGCTVRDLMEAASARAMAAKVSGARGRVHRIHLDTEPRPATPPRA